MTKDPQILAQKAILWTKILAGLTILAIVSNSFEILMLSDIVNGVNVSLEKAEWNDYRQIAVGIVAAIANIIHLVVFMRWTYFEVKAARSRHDFPFKPGWSVAYWFIPVVNIVRPYQVLQGLHLAKDSSENWFQNKRSTLIRVFWGVWLFQALWQVPLMKQLWKAQTPEALLTSTLFSSIDDIFTVITYVLLIFVIRQCSKAGCSRAS